MTNKPKPDQGQFASTLPEDDAGGLLPEEPARGMSEEPPKPDAGSGEEAARREAEDMTNENALPGLVSEDIGGAGAALNSML